LCDMTTRSQRARLFPYTTLFRSHVEKLRSGHETVELWSDDYRKWIYLDGNTGWYIKDVKTGIPLSIWEIRERQLAAIYGKDYPPDRKSTRLNSSHVKISYAVVCL